MLTKWAKCGCDEQRNVNSDILLWFPLCAEGALQLQRVCRVRYSDDNISSLTCSPVPEILKYNRPGVFSHFVVLNITYDEDSRGTITLRSLYTHLNGQDVCKTQDRLHEELYLYNVCQVYKCFVRLHNASTTKNQYIISGFFIVLLLNEMIHRMTKNAPSPINQSF